MSTTTTTRTRSRHETVTRFLAALAGPRDEGELLELRYRLDDGQRMGQLFDHPTRLSGLATRKPTNGQASDEASPDQPATDGVAREAHEAA